MLPSAGTGSERKLAGSGVAAMVHDVQGKATRTDEDEEVTPQRVRERAAPVQKTKPSRRLEAGDLICGQCGEGNAPTRKFCSRCGNELATAEVVKPKWWRKLMFWQRFRRPKVMEAGSRPGQGGAKPRLGKRAWKAYRKVRAVMALIVFVGGILYLFLPPLRNHLNGFVASPMHAISERVNKKFNPQFVPVRPSQTAASAEIPDHGGALAVDKISNNYWAAPFDPANFPRLTLTFDKPVTISKIIVTSGAGEEFAANHRPSLLHLVYSNNQSDDVRPTDGDKPQTFELANAKDVTAIEVDVTEVFRAQNATNVAIAEIELFAKE